MNRDIAFGTIAELQAAFASGAATPWAVTKATLERIEACRDLNLFVTVETGEALRRAGSLPEQAEGRLRGVPVAHKDIFARADRQPGCGVCDSIADAGLPASPLLERFDRAGAIDLGPVQLAEFALGITGDNACLGPARNPWNAAYCTGASSSASAAAVAAGLAWGSLATDSGASIRVPAGFCGVAGLMPTHGALTSRGCFPLSWSMDCIGVIGRTLADTALLYEVASDAGIETPRPDTLRIGLPRTYYTEGLHPEIADALAEAARVLEAAGHVLADTDVVETPELRGLNRAIMRAEAAAVHGQAMVRHPERYSLSVRRFISSGEGVFAVDYIDALRLRPRLRAEALARNFAVADVLLVPVSPTPALPYAELSDAADEKVWRIVGRMAHFTQPASYFGFPALSVPFRLTAGGLPVGAQLIARPGREGDLFAAGRALEAHWRGLGVRPPVAA